MIITQRPHYSQSQLEAYKIYKSDMHDNECADLCNDLFTCSDCVHYRAVVGKESLAHENAIMHCPEIGNKYPDRNGDGYAQELGICYRGKLFEIARVRPNFQLF